MIVPPPLALFVLWLTHYRYDALATLIVGVPIPIPSHTLKSQIAVPVALSPVSVIEESKQEEGSPILRGTFFLLTSAGI